MMIRSRLEQSTFRHVFGTSLEDELPNRDTRRSYHDDDNHRHHHHHYG